MCVGLIRLLIVTGLFVISRNASAVGALVTLDLSAPEVSLLEEPSDLIEAPIQKSVRRFPTTNSFKMINVGSVVAAPLEPTSEGVFPLPNGVFPSEIFVIGDFPISTHPIGVIDGGFIIIIGTNDVPIGGGWNSPKPVDPNSPEAIGDRLKTRPGRSTDSDSESGEDPASSGSNEILSTHDLTAVITELILLNDGSFQVVASGQPNAEYVVEASSNLDAWVELGTAANQLGTLRFTDSDAESHSHRFYRVTQKN
jgi:hypothetical protein